MAEVLRGDLKVLEWHFHDTDKQSFALVVDKMDAKESTWSELEEIVKYM